MTIRMTNEQYIAKGGNHCPFCESGEISADGMGDFFGTDYSQEVRCDSCGKRWADLYVMYAYVEIDS